VAPVFAVNLGLELVVAEVIGTPGTWDFANLPPSICRLGFLISVYRDVNATGPFFESETFMVMFRMGDERPQEAWSPADKSAIKPINGGKCEALE
jgi:hypothetical protein